jgi:uridine kinase
MSRRAQTEAAVREIVAARGDLPAQRSVLVAVSGIDGSGKGYVSARIVEALVDRGLRVAALSVDGWLNLPRVRFDPAKPAEHFYEHAIRFEEMFQRLVLPLRDRRSVRLEADFTEETATEYRRHVYEFVNVDVIVLEGIYLLKRALRSVYDLSFWIECTFETALERAIARAQEGLPAHDTMRAYRTIYFPAQEIHFARDDPKAAASAIVDNDPRLDLGRRGGSIG